MMIMMMMIITIIIFIIVFTSCLRDSIFSFLAKNEFIETKIQKWFTPKISGVLEHTSMMASIIDKARIKQRSVVITLIDLKNAFGEVHHNLITEVLNHHHVPLCIQTLISNLYENFQTSIITDNFTSPAISVGRGVLQGDCLSPLLFNICFNTFIQVISKINTNNSVSLHMILLIVSLTLFIGSNSQMTQRSLQLTSAKINSF